MKTDYEARVIMATTASIIEALNLAAHTASRAADIRGVVCEGNTGEDAILFEKTFFAIRKIIEGEEIEALQRCGIPPSLLTPPLLTQK